MNTPESRPHAETKVRLLNRRIPNLWFRPKRGEKTLYKWLGVGLYKQFLPTSGDLANKYLWHRNRPQPSFSTVDGQVESIDYRTRQVEVMHILLSVPVLLLAHSFAEHGNNAFLAGTLVAEFGVNVYPIWLSRMVRLRTHPIVEWKRNRRLSNETPTRDMVN